MKDEKKTKKHIDELTEISERIARLEVSEARFNLVEDEVLRDV